MNVLSLFDGISGAAQALKNLNIIPKRYITSEIDTYATTVSMKHFPDMFRVGDIANIKHPEVMTGKIDLMIWGSPCQDLSIAKKDRKGLDGERSGLFWKALEIWKIVQPRLLLE